MNPATEIVLSTFTGITAQNSSLCSAPTGTNGVCLSPNDGFLEETDVTVDHLPNKIPGKHYTCRICLKKSSNLSNHKMHCRTHEIQKKFRCNQCSKAYTHERALRTHLKYHAGEIEFSCSLCGKQFAYRHHLEGHLRSHYGTRDYKCEICDKSFLHAQNLRTHKRQVHQQSLNFECMICKERFATVTGLRLHEHKHKTPRPFGCKQCKSTFMCQPDLDKHIAAQHTVSKTHTCEFCGKVLRDASALATHRRFKHTLEKPYRCEYCNRGFSHSSDLNRHRRTHTGERPYVCNCCGEQFSQLVCLKDHKTRWHPFLEGQNTYKCNRCEFETDIQSQYRKHLRLHLSDVRIEQRNSDIANFKERMGPLVQTSRSHEPFVEDESGVLDEVVLVSKLNADAADQLTDSLAQSKLTNDSSPASVIKSLSLSESETTKADKPPITVSLDNVANNVSQKMVTLLLPSDGTSPLILVPVANGEQTSSPFNAKVTVSAIKKKLEEENVDGNVEPNTTKSFPLSPSRPRISKRKAFPIRRVFSPVKSQEMPQKDDSSQPTLAANEKVVLDSIVNDTSNEYNACGSSKKTILTDVASTVLHHVPNKASVTATVPTLPKNASYQRVNNNKPRNVQLASRAGTGVKRVSVLVRRHKKKLATVADTPSKSLSPSVISDLDAQTAVCMCAYSLADNYTRQLEPDLTCINEADIPSFPLRPGGSARRKTSLPSRFNQFLF